MRILALDRHYWPDTTPYAHILRTIVEHLAAQGHEVTVFTAQPSYNDHRGPQQPWRESRGSVDIRRVRLLPESKRRRVLWLGNCVYFLFRGLLHTLLQRRRYDVILGAPSHPILSAFAISWIGYLTSTPYILHSQDIHPEAAACVGLISRGWFFQFLKRIDMASYASAAFVIAISEDQREYLVARQPELGKRLVVIPNPPLDVLKNSAAPLPSGFLETLDDGAEPFRLIFAGNLGNFQALDQVAEAISTVNARGRDGMVRSVGENAGKASDLFQPTIQVHFVGEGLAKSRLRERLKEFEGRSVFFWPQQSVEVAFAMMRASHLGIVSLHPGMSAFAFPSKMAMYLAAGCPVLAVVEPHTELAGLVKSRRLGVVASSSAPADIAAAITQAEQNRDRWDGMERERITRAGEQLFGRDQILAAWSRLLPTPVTAVERRAA